MKNFLILESIIIKPNVESHRIPERERALTKSLMVKIRVNHNYEAAQGFGADF